MAAVSQFTKRPGFAAAAAVSLLLVLVMGYVRLVVYPSDLVPLAYSLPLLAALWHLDRRLLWSMAGLFLVMAAWKMLVLVPDENVPSETHRLTFLAMQWLNVLLPAGVVDAVVVYRQRLESANARLELSNSELEASNEELASREEEIVGQNEELQVQGEELERQAEELRVQTEELTVTTKELADREQVLQLLLQIAGPTEAEQEVLCAVCRAAPDLLGGGTAAAMVERRDGSLVIRAHVGLDGAALSASPTNNTLAQMAIERNQTASLPDASLRRDIQLPSSASGESFASALAAPFLVEGEMVGALEVYDLQPRIWEPRQAQLLEWLAAHGATAVKAIRLKSRLREVNESLEARVAERTVQLKANAEELRRLAAQLTSLEQQERRRIAHILHDELQQLLVAAHMRLSHARSADGDEAKMHASDLIRQAIELSRSLTTELCPPILHEERFESALRWLAQRIKEKHALAVQVYIDPSAEPDGADWKVFLFNAVNECLFNVVKHAGVEEAELRVQRDAEQLRVVIEDRGRGFDLASIERASQTADRFGLFNLRHRCSLLGGSARIESGPGQGTRIELIAPAAECESDTLAVASEGNHAPARRIKAPSDGDSDVIRVLIADDHRVLREGVAALLNTEADMEVVAEAADGQEAVHLARQHLPDVVVMDITMPRMSGIEATRLLRETAPSLKVVAMSMHETEQMVAAMYEAGAVGYVAKGSPTEQLVHAIRRAVAGQETAMKPS
jgi:signal transduction histidine kinase/ActR/RegA family two-component response regulator